MGRTWFGWAGVGAEALGCNAPGAGGEGPAGFLLPKGGLSKAEGLGTAVPKQAVCS